MAKAKSMNRRVELTDEEVKEAPFARKGFYILRDTKLSGFLCIVRQKAKLLVYQVEHREKDGKRRVVYKRLGDPIHSHVATARADALAEWARLERLTKPEAKAGTTFANAWRMATGPRLLPAIGMGAGYAR